MLTWENTWKDIEDSAASVAVVPVGSTEQHGTNLPLASDSLSTARLAEALAEQLDAYLVPLIPIGTSHEHLSFRGTVTLEHDTLKAVIRDIVDSLVRTGFQTIIVTTMHGGNLVLRPESDFIPELDEEYPGARILVAYLQHAFEEAWMAAGFATFGTHADECEASMVASLQPELVGSNPTDFPVDSTDFPSDVRQLSPGGSLGEPSRGSGEKGDVFWRVLLEVAVADAKRRLA